jgi:SRSO17 transposase
MEQVRPRLEAFAAEMLGGLTRSDQRAKGELYLRGLLVDGKRKSMQPMAARLGVEHQQLQQFVTSSTWDHVEVRKRVARWADDVFDPEAYVVDDSGFPKDGSDSPGVARMYSGTLGKVGNCQIGVSVHAVTDAASVAINWALFLPESWDDTTTDANADAETIAQIRRRRARCKIPDGVRHREKWRLALDMLDQIIGSVENDQEVEGGHGVESGGWGLPRRTIVADAGYGDITGFRLGLEQRGLHYVVAAKGSTSAYSVDAVPTAPAYSGRGRPPKPRYRDDPSNLTALALAAGRSAVTHLTWRRGSRRTPANPSAAMRSHFLAIRVRPANREIPRNTDGSLPECWLIAEWPPDKAEPTDYWLSNLPVDTPLQQLVRLAKIRWRIEHDYRELKDGLGLDHFEGRSYTGWHRHVTLAALAQAFCSLLRNDPKAPAPA